VLFWRLSDHPHAEECEKLAHRLVGIGFLALAAYIAFDASRLACLEPSRFSYFGIVYAEACVIIMPPCGPPASAAPQMPPEKPPKQLVVAPDVVPPLGGGLSGAPACEAGRCRAGLIQLPTKHLVGLNRIIPCLKAGFATLLLVRLYAQTTSLSVAVLSRWWRLPKVDPTVCYRVARRGTTSPSTVIPRLAGADPLRTDLPLPQLLCLSYRA
jgi:hypothetical protein